MDKYTVYTVIKLSSNAVFAGLVAAHHVDTKPCKINRNT